MDLQKCKSIAGISSTTKVRSILSNSSVEKDQLKQEKSSDPAVKIDVNVDTREVHLLVLFFLSDGPCQKTFKQYLNELLEYGLLPRRYHAWYSRHGEHSGMDNDDGVSIPLSYHKLVERYPHIEKDHLVKLLKQLLLNIACPRDGKIDEEPPNAADVPTLLGSGSFSLLNGDEKMDMQVGHLQVHRRWPHLKANQVHGLSFRELGGGFAKHHRAPSVRSACYAIAKPSTVVQNMQNFKKLRGHRNAVYCAIFDRSGRYVITGSDDRLVKIWSMETAFCLASCRGHEGDITDLAVSSNNALVASASNDFIIRVWRLPEGIPISVLRGHTGAVTAIAFSPRPNYELLSSSDDGSCRIWDARYSQHHPRIYLPKPTDSTTGKRNGSSSCVSSSSLAPQNNQILCCAYNANGTVFVTGSSDTFARVWSACISSPDRSDEPIHEMDMLACHEDDVNYVQFSGCAVASRFTLLEALRDDNLPKLRNPWLCHDYIVTCSRDGSAIIWSPRSRKYHGQSMRWAKLYQMKVPAPPLPPRPPRGGPRQRILPTPRGVNMIIWSLDNRFVLAAIMDCRICVWNAENSSLVHSLTGHTASSYVLDVHPFNPRIAMSAGYDGRAIIWDIWEGIPIRTYEVGRFKLVDGKFSPDGTSIVLSDDVGQIYLLSTGQGESVKDAKYDQFFLGDYRPLVHDTAGNVLDQETQLPPHRRNMQDPLCDSSWMPYPDPYQTMFQKRRLGILGIEWRPPSIPFAVGPDVSLGQDYHMPPLEDWDRIIEPVPDFVDAIYWEPENEVLHDDTDSEYNAAEEFASEDEQVSLLHSSSSDPSSSSEESDVECRQMDGRRRSRRILKAEVQSVTAARKRIKKRNLDDCDGHTTENNKGKKSRSGRKVCKRKAFSKEKSLRPQRVAARNAQNLLNGSTGMYSDGDDEDVSEVDTSSSESRLPDSDVGCSKPERNSWSMQENFVKDKKIVPEDKDTLTPSEVPESQFSIRNTKKIVLKISLRDPKKPDSLEGSKLNCGNQDSFLKRLTGISQEKDTNLSSEDPGSPFTNVDVKPLLDSYRTDFAHRDHPEKENIIGVAGCSSEAEVTPGYASIIHSAGFDAQKENKVGFARDDNLFGTNASRDYDASTCKELTPDRIHHSMSVSSPQIHLQSGYRASECSSSPVFSKEDQLNVNHHLDLLKTSELSEANHSQDLKESKPLVLPRFKIKTKGDLTDSGGPKVRFVNAVNKSTTSRGVLISGNHPHQSQKEEPRVAKDVLEVSHAVVTEDALNAKKFHGSGFGSSEAETTSVGRTRSMKAISRASNAVDNKFRIKMAHGWTESSMNVGSRFLSEEGTSCSKWSVGSRSTRSRQGSSSLPTRKLSWLLLSKHEEGYRYIPQISDEVVYVRQGHQEYVKAMARERGPWTYVKDLEAVEICKIVSLEYDTVAGSGDSCCKMELKCLNPSSSAFGQTFKLTLPELIDFPDFVVEKKRYDTAVSRDWTCGERCRVWWRNENGEGGSWWHGHIHSLQANSAEYPDSLWERFVVHYDSTPNEDHPHCPWELQDLHTPWEHPHIDFEVREELLFLFNRLEEAVAKHEDRYGVKKLNEVFDRLDFFNRFPVPLCPDLIQARLQNNYYRSLEAVEHDIELMIKNAQLYFQRNTELLNKMHRLSNWFHRKLLKIKELLP